VALFTAGLLADLVVSPRSGLARIMSIRSAVAIGGVSYCIYLFHFPIFQYVQHRRMDRATEPVADYLALTGAVLGSWLLVEKPFLRLKSKYGPRSALNQRPSANTLSISPPIGGERHLNDDRT
jgi:peptidoglycan/LPS O-acetylase OafA/YrhL